MKAIPFLKDLCLYLISGLFKLSRSDIDMLLN